MSTSQYLLGLVLFLLTRSRSRGYNGYNINCFLASSSSKKGYTIIKRVTCKGTTKVDEVFSSSPTTTLPLLPACSDRQVLFLVKRSARGNSSSTSPYRDHMVAQHPHACMEEEQAPQQHQDSYEE
ncbi:hypothetical protein Tco_0612812 [Tanacetum coccineum]